MGRNRSSNLEVLRIVAMLAIVGNHLAVHGAIPINSLTEPLDFKYWFAQALACGGKFGADVFVLISGYFLVGCKPKISGLAKLWLRMVAIGLMAAGLSVGCGGALRSGDVWRAVFPLTHNVHWFMTDYACLLLASPFLARLLRSLTRRQHLFLLAVFFVPYCALPSLLAFPGYAGRPYFDFSPFVWFLYLYCLAAYVRLHMDPAAIRLRCSLSAFAVSAGLVFGCVYGCDWLVRHGYPGWKWQVFRDMNGFFVLAAAFSLFLTFARIRLGVHPWINWIAAGTMGVYLIHDNYLVRPLLWRKWLGVADLYRNDPEFAFKAMAAVFLVFVGCVLADAVIALVVRLVCRLAAPVLDGADDWYARAFHDGTPDLRMNLPCPSDRGRAVFDSAMAS